VRLAVVSLVASVAAAVTGLAGCGDDPCEPTGGGPYWLTEGETVVTTPIVCASGKDDVTFAVTGVPPGAVYDEAARTITWTPGLDQAMVAEVVVTASTDETAISKIGVADAWDDPANVPVVDPLAYPEEYGLPVLFVSPRPVTEEYAPTEIVFGRRAWAAEGKLRGAASLGYPKNSYTLKFAREDKFQAEAQGMPDRRKLVLISTFDDNSYLRQRLGYELWNQLDPAHVQIKVFSAVVYVDGEYWGLYTVADHVDGFLMEDHGLRQDGNLYKAIDHNANFATVDYTGAPKPYLHLGYEKKDGLPVDDFSDLDALVDFVANTDDATFRDQVFTRVERADYEDWWIFATALLADDSAGKNSYHYHDPLAATPWRCTPWDLNHSFGQTWQTEREAATTFMDYTGMNRLFARFLAEPAIGDPLRARYGAVLRDLWPVDGVLAQLEMMHAEIDASAQRDERKWAAAYQTYGGWSWRSDFTTYAEEYAYLRQWILDRWAYQATLYP
jgi:spore coat protein H